VRGDSSSGAPGPGAIGPAEIHVALASDDPMVRAAALRGITIDAATEPLVLTALHDDHPTVRMASAKALGGSISPQAARALIEASAVDPSPEVRAGAVESLGRILSVRLQPPGGA
jgi:HEAT repeat protein